jgi:two-component system, NarL family, sensor histidine kinase DevS
MTTQVDSGHETGDDEPDFSLEAAISALDAATRAIAGELDLDRVLQLIVDSVRELVAAQYAALGIVDASGRIERFITSGISTEQRARIGALPRGHGLLGLIIREGRAYRIPDISQHADAYGFPPGHPPMRSFLGVPIRIGGQPIGNFYLTDRIGAAAFSDRDQRLVEIFAFHAGIGIENARLHARVQQLAVLDERVRIGRDLHDGIIQGIYAVALSLEDVPDLMAAEPGEAAARVDRAIDRLNLTIGEIRTYILGLGSGAADVSVGARLAAIVDEAMMLSTTGLHLSLEVDAEAIARVERELPSDVAAQLIQIVRESLSNTLRHASASRARVALDLEGDAAVITIEDDGRGFDPGQPRGAGHLGLANLHDRAASVGGALEIRSAAGAGTRIIARFPLSPAEAQT